MAKGEFDMLYLCAGEGGGAMIFSFDESKPWDDQGGFKKIKGKTKEIIIAHPLDKLWMLPYHCLQTLQPTHPYYRWAVFPKGSCRNS